MSKSKTKISTEYVDQLNTAVHEIHGLMSRHRCMVNDIDIATAFPNRKPALTADVVDTWGPVGLLGASQAMTAMLQLEQAGHDFDAVLPEFSNSGKGGRLKLNIAISESTPSVLTFKPTWHTYTEHGLDVERPVMEFDYQQNSYDGEWHSILHAGSPAEIEHSISLGKRLSHDSVPSFTDDSEELLDNLFERDAFQPGFDLCELAMTQLFGFKNQKIATIMVYHLLKWGAIEDRFIHFAENEFSMDKEEKTSLEMVMQHAKRRLLHDELSNKFSEKLLVDSDAKEHKLKI